MITIENQKLKTLNLSNEEHAILVWIHELSDHRIKVEDLIHLEEKFPDLEEQLESLLAKEFIEYEKGENSYYLSYEGFEALESIKRITHPQKDSRKSDIEQYKEIVNSLGGAKRLQRIIIIGMMVFGISISIFLYRNPEIAIMDKSEKKEKLDDTTLEEINSQVQKMIDSIQNSETEKY